MTEAQAAWGLFDLEGPLVGKGASQAGDGHYCITWCARCRGAVVRCSLGRSG